MLRVLLKNGIMTSLPVTEGTPFFKNLSGLNQGKVIFLFKSN